MTNSRSSSAAPQKNAPRPRDTAKAQTPIATPDGNGEFHARAKLPTGEPVPEVITRAPAMQAAIDQLPIPRGAVKVLVRILALSGANLEEAAAVAYRWAGGTDDPRCALLGRIVDEVRAEPSAARGPSVVPLCQQVASLRRALERVAFEPQGRAEASHREVLSAVERIAKDALAEVPA